MKQAFRYPQDKYAVRNLVAAYASEYPAQMFCAVDDRDRAAVILHFADADDNRDFETVFFSSLDAAKKAFAFLKSIDVNQIYSELPF